MTGEHSTLTGQAQSAMHPDTFTSTTEKHAPHAPSPDPSLSTPTHSATSVSQPISLEPLKFGTSRAEGSYEGERTPSSPLSPLEASTSTSAVRKTSTDDGGDDEEYSLKEFVSREGDDIVDSRGKVVFPPETPVDEEAGPIPRPNPFVDLSDVMKPSSPLPWELIDPPAGNGQRDTTGSQKYQTLHSTLPRPLKPKSSYYFGPPAPDSAYGTPPVGHIGVHQPREILRIERDYTGGELIQFAPIYPLELEGRITPTQFLESVNSMNEILISAYSARHAFLENVLSVLTLQLSRLIMRTHYEREMGRLHTLIDRLNAEIYNPFGLNILWPRKTAFLFLEIEYYVGFLSGINPNWG